MGRQRAGDSTVSLAFLVGRHFDGNDATQSDERRSPGHDREIPLERFLELEPDLLNAELVPSSKLDYNLPRYLRPGAPHAESVRYEYWRTDDPSSLVRLAWWSPQR